MSFRSSGLRFYAFPLFSMILRFLEIVVLDEAELALFKRLFSRGDRGFFSAVSSCGDSVGAFVPARSYHSAPLLAQSSRVPR